MSPAVAVGLIEEPGVVPLLRRLMEFEHDLARPLAKASSKAAMKGRARP
jgi:hypothetical protein